MSLPTVFVDEIKGKLEIKLDDISADPLELCIRRWRKFSG